MFAKKADLGCCKRFSTQCQMYSFLDIKCKQHNKLRLAIVNNNDAMKMSEFLKLTQLGNNTTLNKGMTCKTVTK